jgi:hypothetical protein
VEVTPNFPQACRFVLETLGEVYGYDAQAEELGLSPQERLRFHQEYSGPVMEKLHAWLKVQSTRRKWSRTPAWVRRSRTSSGTGIA